MGHSQSSNRGAQESMSKKPEETREIGNDVVNLKALLQRHKEESLSPARKTEVSQRAGRFCSELITQRTFGRVTYTGDPTIVEKWLNKRKFNFKIDKEGYNVTDAKDMPQLREVVALAIRGILREGKEGNWKSFAETLAKRLQKGISKHPRLIFRECIYIYTNENKPGVPSLYSIVNRALREIDYRKVETLGPYCYLLNFALKALSHEDADFFHKGKVYRGLGLEDNMLEMYKTAWKRGLQVSFHSFVSTSKSPEVAIRFSLFQENQRKVLLVIENLGGGAYIETLTAHRGEKEVLLPASCGFQITNIDEADSDMIIIFLRMIDTQLKNLQENEESLSAILLSHSSFTELPPSLSQFIGGNKVYFEISEDGTNITPEDKSHELKKCVELAAEGIRKFKNTQDGIKMAEMLRKTMKESPGDIFKIIVKLYTMVTFLYFQANQILRSESSEKLNYFGPYCYLLNSYQIAINKKLSESDKLKFVTLYRGTHCTPTQMNIFKELYAKNLHFAFSSFTSTTTERRVAEHFPKNNPGQSILHVISVPESMVLAFDLSRFSVFPDQKELLLPPNISFKITNIDLETSEIFLEFIDYII